MGQVPPRTNPMRVNLFCDGKYLAGVFMAPGNAMYTHLHTQTTENKWAAIRFCSADAASKVAAALNTHGGPIWNVVESRDVDSLVAQGGVSSS